MTNFNQKLSDILKKDLRFIDQDGDLLKTEVINRAWKVDEKLIELLLEDTDVKQKFFSEIRGYWIFNVAKFVEFVQDKNFLNDSYTKFKNKIGLTIDGKYLNQRGEVALAWAYKDCVLEGGMSDEENGKDEIFFNEVLAQDEIDRLLDPKVLTNGKKFDKDGEKKFDGFTRDEDGLIKDNLIIKGNNLLALHSLKKEFSGKVKLIYIDPPYNTGNDGFRYNDRFNHSTWLTFMKNRLEVARELLREDGVIFVQCDDNEQAYLKILVDEVFGRKNFVGNFIWHKKLTGGYDNKNLNTQHEYILFYANKKENISVNPEKVESKYKLVDEDGRRYKWDSLWNVGGLTYSKSLEYPIEAPDGTEIWPFGERGKSFWLWSRDKVEKEREKLKFEKDKNGHWKVYKRVYASEGIVPGSILKKEIVGGNTNSSAEIKKLFGGKAFSYLKPEGLMSYLIERITNEREIVLDYHLGSGTTCAVAHKMGRQYIGIEQMDYVETIACERLKKVIEGEQGGISKAVDWKSGGSFVYFELKKYNEEFIDKIQSAKTTADLGKIWEEMKAKSFLDWNVDFRNADLAFEDWKQLDFEKQQHALVELLNKNQLYVNLSEIDDKNFKCTDEERRLSAGFYNSELQ